MKNLKTLVAYKNNLHIYFIGIGGKGLNGIAKYCLQKGWTVSGSDLSVNSEIFALKALGANIVNSHNKENITDNIDVVVYSSIVNKNNPEIIEAKKRNIPIVKRSKFLGVIMRQHNLRISIAGSHGKSTTTALCGLALSYSDLDPTVFGGAYTSEFNGYERFGSGRYAVAEACEYDESFLDLISDISIITAVEKSHMEYYKTESDYIHAFKTFVNKHTSDAFIIANGDSKNINTILKNAKATVETFGFGKENNYTIQDIRYESDCSIFDIYYHDVCIAKDITILIPGDYNIYNFTAIAVLLHVLDLPLTSIYRIGRSFEGVGRRFDIITKENGPIFVDDFCHHPTQVQNLFSGIHQFFPNKKVCAVFQPRQYHLIKTFLKEYGSAFRGADSVIVTDIVPALGDTEEDKHSLVSNDVIDSIKKYSNKSEVSYMPNFEDIVSSIKKSLNNDWVVATIGAGDVYKIRDLYVNS